MRIIAGAWGGRALQSPPGATTRPTGDRMREALFSMLTSRLGSFEDLRIADIFAGTGALGLEALSRGAAHCTFVERDRPALEALKTNIERLGASALADVRAQSAETFAGGPYDVVLLDPPYGTSLGQRALARLTLAPGAWASIETEVGEDAAVPGFAVDAIRTHGKAKLTLMRYQG